jgi:hypothetical protein
LQDIVDRPASAEGLVIAIGVDGEGADELSVLGDDADVGTGDQQSHPAVLVGHADREVAELAQVAQGDLAEGIDLVVANAVVDEAFNFAAGLGMVVVVAEAVELELQLGE